MLSVSYAGKNAYSAGKTSGVLRGDSSDANRCYVLAHYATHKIYQTQPKTTKTEQIIDNYQQQQQKTTKETSHKLQTNNIILWRLLKTTTK